MKIDIPRSMVLDSIVTTVQYSDFSCQYTEKCWYDRYEQLHRDDGPAKIIYCWDEEISQEWYQFGKLHRDGGPAVIDDHREIWYQHGQRHRDGDLPALIDYHNDRKIWYQNGEYHRDGGPAIITYKGDRAISHEWYQHGKCHRDDDMPAKTYWIPWRDGWIEEWHQNGQCHRDGDLPAKITYDDNDNIIESVWYKHGQCHRDLAPALISKNLEIWYQNGQRHRDNDMPAEIHQNDDGSIIQEWYQHDKCHRDGDLPAKISIQRDITCKEWYINGQRHRTGGPAIIDVWQHQNRLRVRRDWYQNDQHQRVEIDG